jgi:uncharacterized protein GlcG (DUF336 family)
MVHQTGISLAEAQYVVEAVLAEAERMGIRVNVAVVDAGANLVAFSRQDGAWIGSIELAVGKAFTAKAFEMPTAILQKEAEPGGAAFGIDGTNGGRLVVFPGGMPIERAGVVIGAVGVSGGTAEQDQACAEAGVAAHLAAHVEPPESIV